MTIRRRDGNGQANIGRGLALLSVLIAANTASAQSQQEEEFLLEEIVVTALRRAEGTSLMDTSISMDAMTGEDLEAKGVGSVMDALSMSPGVSVAKSSAVGNAVQIRGVSAIIGDAVVGYYMDDLPYTRISANVAPDMNPYDLNRVEVLRGPQGTLFGAGSQGGVVRIITQDPIMNQFEGKFTAGYSATGGGSDSHKVQGAINIPLIEDTLAMRIVAAQVDSGGYIDLPLTGENDFNELDDSSHRVKLLWTPTEELSITASYWHSDRNGHENWAEDDLKAYYTFTNFDAVFGLPGATELTQPVGSDSMIAETRNDLYGLTVDYATDSFTFVSTTSYLDGGYRSSLPIPAVGVRSAREFEELDTFAQEFKLSSINEGSWNWTVGAIYLDMENRDVSISTLFAQDPANFAILAAFGVNENTVSEHELTSKSWAVFGESVHELGDQWELTLGLRYFEDEREEISLDGSGYKVDGSWDQWTGRINLAWRPVEDSLYYINIAQGFRAGGLLGPQAIADAASLGVNLPSLLDPDEVISYEVGGKWTLLNGRLQLESAIYHLQWDSIQSFVTAVTPPPENRATGWAVNGNEASGTGFEFGAAYQIEGLVLSASGNWSKMEYEGSIPGAGIEDGATMMQTPELTLSASASYHWPVGEFEGVAFLGATYTDERSDYSPPDLTYTSDAFTLVNARVGVVAEHWSVFLTGENITDQNPEVSQLAALIQFGVDPVRMRPATYGVEVNYKF
ncbi:TonB-dependent receptor [Pseudomaricurvus alkylphenolicus]|uniref:TonB-dependent receptor n=1 Tax=Pseudomaricurvus alkylphenolicus TaxID=1306991 RepID=UPI001421E422|nr:TonB-dependent receptor [Pseudomaricurvus alkylphenolicus]NIB42413.1 TonB-dependent receptor [Pseudomaricurvus alkylphenolicus]